MNFYKPGERVLPAVEKGIDYPYERIGLFLTFTLFFISSYSEAIVTAWRLPDISIRKETMFALLIHLSSTWQKVAHIHLTPQWFDTLIE